MASSESHCRRVSYIQLEALCEILNRHRDVAMGRSKSQDSREVWEMVARTLNSLGDDDCVDKYWSGWSAYWVDYKAKLKEKLLAIRSSRTLMEGSLSDAGELDHIQLKFLDILGHDFIDEPTADGIQTVEMPLLKVKEERLSPSPDLSGPSDPMEVRERGEPVAASLGSTRVAECRRRRAEAPYSQQTARHLFLQSTLARMRQARQNDNALLKALSRIARRLEGIQRSLSSEINVRE